MQKTINIDGKDVDFKFTLSAFYLFKNQFGYDAMTKIIPLIGEVLSNFDFDKKKEESKEKEEGKEKEEDNFYQNLGYGLESIYNFEITDVCNLIWAFAKNANEDIGDVQSFYGSFETFPIIDVVNELLPTLLESLGSKKKLTKNTRVMKKA